MGFISIMKKVGGAVLPIGTKVLLGANPIVGSIVSVLLESILHAESDLTDPSSGAVKKIRVINETMPTIVRTIEALTGREIVDEEKIRGGVSKIIDGIVDVLNATPAKTN